MPSFTFIGDEPLSLPCSVMINDKAKQAFIKADNAKDSSPTQAVAPSITAVKPSLVAMSSQEKYGFRLYHSKPGSLGVTISMGAQYCTVTDKVNQNSLLQVDDIIISCNGRRYDAMIKLEDGKTAWVNFLKGQVVKCFVVLRQAGKAVPAPAPLKDVSNTQMSSARVRACSTGTSKKDLLLAQVQLQWRPGKSCRQTYTCKAAIRTCLLNGISPIDISDYVARSMNEDIQAQERKRARSCANNLSKSLKIQAAGKALPATISTTETTDIEDLVSLGIPFQQNGVIYKRGDNVKKRKVLRKEAVNISEKLDSNSSGGINLESSQDVGIPHIEMDQAKLRSTGTAVTTVIVGNTFDTTVITPSNSMEEVDATSSDN